VNDSLKHITLNSGHVRDSPRSEVADEVLDAVRLLVVKTGAFDVPGQPGFKTHLTLDRGAAVFDVCIDDAPIVIGAVAWQTEYAATIWSALEIMAKQFGATKKPTLPATLPWLAVLLLPTAEAWGDAMQWLGDYERCLAWAILEENQESKST
jgi:hypothetical protein